MIPTILLLLLGCISFGVIIYWTPFLLLNRLRWTKRGGDVRLSWESYSSADHPEPRWLFVAAVVAAGSTTETKTKVFPLFADNIFPTLAQLELRISELQRAHLTSPLESLKHPIFFWASCVKPEISKKGAHNVYVGFLSGILVLLISLVGLLFLHQ